QRRLPHGRLVQRRALVFLEGVVAQRLCVGRSPRGRPERPRDLLVIENDEWTPVSAGAARRAPRPATGPRRPGGREHPGRDLQERVGFSPSTPELPWRVGGTSA